MPLPSPALYYQLTLSFNPVSANHWIKRRFFDVPQENALLCRSTYLDNRFIDPQFHQRMLERKARDPEGYRIYGQGEWGESGGRILTDYTVETFDTDPARFDATAIGQDFGFNHANAILQLAMKDGELYVLREIYEREKDTAELIRIAERRGFPKGVRMLCDSAEPDRIRTWQRAGLSRACRQKGTGERLGADRLAQAPQNSRARLMPKHAKRARSVAMGQSAGHGRMGGRAGGWIWTTPWRQCAMASKAGGAGAKSRADAPAGKEQR